MSEEIMNELIFRKGIMKDYLFLKIKEEDWHGVCDAANDLREIEVMICCEKKNGKAEV